MAERHGWDAAKLAERYAAPMRAYIGRILADPADADDATQNALVRAAKVAHRLRPDPWPYLRVLARNAAYDLLRDEARRGVIDLTADERAFPAVDAIAAATDHAHRAEAVAAMFAALSPKHAAMLRDRAEGASEAELARRYHLSAGSVSVILTRARHRARAALEAALADTLAAFGGWRVLRDRLAVAARDRLTAWSLALPLADPAAAVAAMAVAAVAVAALVVAASPATVTGTPAAAATTPTAAAPAPGVAVPPPAPVAAPVPVPAAAPRPTTTTTGPRSRVMVATATTEGTPPASAEANDDGISTTAEASASGERGQTTSKRLPTCTPTQWVPLLVCLPTD